MYLVLVFASILVCCARSANVNKHLKLLSDIEKINNLENNAVFPVRTTGLRKFLSVTKRPRATYMHPSGEMLELTCEAMGMPAPSIHWFKNDAPVYEYDLESNELIKNNPSSLARISSTLLIPKTEDHDVYSCLITSGIKTARETSLVYGTDDSTQLTERAKLYPLQPRIVVSYEIFVDSIGNNVVLPCRVKGHPKPLVVWRDNRGVLIKKDSRMKVLRSGELVISPLMWRDMGEFTCYATNVFGSQFVKTFVYPAKVH